MYPCCFILIFYLCLTNGTSISGFHRSPKVWDFAALGPPFIEACDCGWWWMFQSISLLLWTSGGALGDCSPWKAVTHNLNDYSSCTARTPDSVLLSSLVRKWKWSENIRLMLSLEHVEQKTFRHVRHLLCSVNTESVIYTAKNCCSIYFLILKIWFLTAFIHCSCQYWLVHHFDPDSWFIHDASEWILMSYH